MTSGDKAREVAHLVRSPRTNATAAAAAVAAASSRPSGRGSAAIAAHQDQINRRRHALSARNATSTQLTMAD